MISATISHSLKIFTFLTMISVPFAAYAGDPFTIPDFNARVIKISNEATRKTLDKEGENSVRCDDMMSAVGNAVIRCKKEKEKCAESKAADGTPVVFCSNDTDECDAVAFTTAEDFWAANHACKEMKRDPARPGCGNTITEFGEDCDLGVDNGTPNAACNDTCKSLAAAAAPAAPQGDAGAAPVGAQPQAGNNASGGCTIQSVENNAVPLWHLLAMGLGTAMILRKPRAKAN